MADQEVDLDSIIDRLLEVRGSRPGKQVQLLESEIRFLCTKAREIFISQPILLELEAPIKVRTLPHFPRGQVFSRSYFYQSVVFLTCSFLIAFDHRFAVISTVNTTISFVCLNTVVSPQRPTISSSVTTSTVVSSHSKPSACSSRIRSGTPRTSSSCVATTSAPPSTVFMASMTSASDDTTSNYGRPSPTASTACPLLPSLTRRFSPCTVV